MRPSISEESIKDLEETLLNTPYPLPDQAQNPPSGLPPGILPLWIQIWQDLDEGRGWSEICHAHNVFPTLQPGDIIACFDDGPTEEPCSIILVTGEPIPPGEHSKLWCVPQLDV